MGKLGPISSVMCYVLRFSMTLGKVHSVALKVHFGVKNVYYVLALK